MKLKRSELINYEENWLKNHPNVKDNPLEYVSFLDGLKKIILKHEYIPNNNFFTYGRRDFLRKEFSDYLNERIHCGRGKFNDAFVDLTDYYSGNTWINMDSVPQNLNFKEVDNADIEYKKEGIICMEESSIILDMIKEFMEHLNVESVVDKFEKNGFYKSFNKDKKILIHLINTQKNVDKIYSFNFETNIIYDIPETNVKFALAGLSENENDVLFFINNVVYGIEGDTSACRGFYEGLSKEYNFCNFYFDKIIKLHLENDYYLEAFII